MSDFGERLREAREQAGLSQLALAERLGIRQQHVSRYEQGGSDPAWSRVVDVADVLGVSLDWLAGRD